MVGSEELYGVGTSTPKRRSDQVKVEILNFSGITRLELRSLFFFYHTFTFSVIHYG